MRKSFKKGIAILAAAALALGTPIAAGNLPIVSGPQTASAKTGSEPKEVELTGSISELKDVVHVEGGWWQADKVSDFYKVATNFEATFNMTMDEDATNNVAYQAPYVILQSQKNMTLAVFRTDRYAFAGNWNSGRADENIHAFKADKEWTLPDESDEEISALPGGTEWATGNNLAKIINQKDNKYQITVKKIAENVSVTTIVTTVDGKKYSQTLTIDLSKVVPDDVYTDTYRADDEYCRVILGGEMVKYTINSIDYKVLDPLAPSSPNLSLPTSIYENDFEALDGSAKGDKDASKVVSLFNKEDESPNTTKGNVYTNDGKEGNYYLLPSDVLASHKTAIGNTRKLSISFAMKAPTDGKVTVFTASTAKEEDPAIKIDSDGTVMLGGAKFKADDVNMCTGDWEVVTVVIEPEKATFYVGGKYNGSKYTGTTSRIAKREGSEGKVKDFFAAIDKLTYVTLGGYSPKPEEKGIKTLAVTDPLLDYAYDDLKIYPNEIKDTQIEQLVYDSLYTNDVNNEGEPNDNGSSVAPAPTLIPTPEPTPAPDNKLVASLKFSGEMTDASYTEGGITFDLSGTPKIVDNPDLANDKVLAVNEGIGASTTGDSFDYLRSKVGALSGCDFSKGVSISMNIKPDGNTNDWNYLFCIGSVAGDSEDSANKYAYVDGALGIIARYGDPWIQFTPDIGWVMGNNIDSNYAWFNDGNAGAGKWSNVTYVYTADKIYIYVNGVEAAEYPGSSSLADIMKEISKGRLNLGSGAIVGLEHFAGYMDDVKIYEGALSADQIKELAEATGDDSGEEVIVPDQQAPTEPTQSPDASQAPTQSPDASQTPAEPTQSPDASQTPDDGKDEPTDNNTQTTKKKALKITSIKAKAGAKKVTGKVSAKKVTVKVKVGKKAYKKAKVSGKTFTLKCAKLKKGTKIKVKATKKNYKKATKTKKVK